MAKVLVVLADGFEEVEALSPVDLLKRAGASVTIAGLGKKEITSSKDIHIVCDTVLEQTALENWDAIVLPGGMPGATNLHNSEEVSRRIMATYNNGGWVCAICASPAVVLAPLGILNDVKAVCYPGMETCAPGVKFLQDKVITNKKIITARGAGCALEFGLEIIQALFGPEKRAQIAQSIVY